MVLTSWFKWKCIGWRSWSYWLLLMMMGLRRLATRLERAREPVEYSGAAFLTLFPDLMDDHRYLVVVLRNLTRGSRSYHSLQKQKKKQFFFVWKEMDRPTSSSCLITLDPASRISVVGFHQLIKTNQLIELLAGTENPSLEQKSRKNWPTFLSCHDHTHTSNAGNLITLIYL